MRIAYLDCFAGLAGDMFLGALIDAGVPVQVLQDAVAALQINATLRVEKVDRSGISSTKVHVLEGDKRADSNERLGSARIEQDSAAPFTAQPRTQHQHKAGPHHSHSHSHEHEHGSEPQSHGHDPTHVHGRSLTQIRSLIQAAPLADPVKQMSIRTFELLGASEARIHNVPVDDIHFHEVGAVDAIADIVGSCAGIHNLGVDAWYCSPINVGGGTVKCAHGVFPVPAPATADLLRGMPTYSAHVQKELVTPTGAAILKMLSPKFGQQPSMQVEHIGYGAGTRDPEGFANVVRLSIGDLQEAGPRPTSDSTAGERQTIVVLETALDDLSPQVLAHVAETALQKGALDVMLTPVIMKKGRPGTLLTILSDRDNSAALENLILSETSTLGLRIREEQRSCLERAHEAVQTPFGQIRVKIGVQDGTILNVAPEFEDCKRAAEHNRVPVKQVLQSAIAAYWTSNPLSGRSEIPS